MTVVTLAVLAARSQSPVSVLFWCGIGFVAGIILFVRGFFLLQRRRLILDTPFSKIRSASMGMVEVSGLAVGPYTMIAPITGRPCYYYRTQIQEYKQQGKNKEWVIVAGECMHLPFFVDDNTGRVLIDPRGADMDLHRDFEQEFCNSFFSTKDPAPANVNSFLSRHGIVTDNKIKVEEFCIKPKNSLFILGTLTENPGCDVTPNPLEDNEAIGAISSKSLLPSLSSVSFTLPLRANDAEASVLAHQSATRSDGAHPEVIRLSTGSTSVKTAGMSQQQKIAAALLKAGITNPAAWSAAGLAAPSLQVVADPTTTGDSKHAGDTSGFDLHPPVVLMKGSNNKTFLISWRSQQDLARSLGWKCTLMIWGGPALALLSLYVFLSVEHLL
jgi:hypothetical protein